MTFWYSMSAAGGLAVTGPAALAILFWLAGARCWRLALHWCLLLAAAILVVVASKVAFFGWGIGLRSLDFAGFSGHAMRAAAVYPVAMFLLLRRAPRAMLVAGVGAGAVLALLVACARVAVHAHSASEAAFGFLLGAAVASSLIVQGAASARLDAPACLPHPAATLCLVALAALPREPVSTHRWMVQMGVRLSGHAQPYNRHTWKMAQPPARRPVRAGGRGQALLVHG